jgi:hydroxysqualene dehydroxylase
LLTLQSLSLRERLSILTVGRKLMFMDPEGDAEVREMTVSEWLRHLGQSEETRKYLWDIIAIGTLNDSPDKVSASLFATVLRSAFFGPRINSSMVIPSSGLSEIFVDPAERFLTDRGSVIRKNCGVREIVLQPPGRPSSVKEVYLENGEIVQPAAVVCAVPFFSIQNIFTDEDLRSIPQLKTAENFTSSPIISIHLWFDRTIIADDFVALIDSPVHWIFNKTALYEKKPSDGQYLSLVISGAADVVGLTKEDIVALCLRELRTFYSAAGDAVLLHSVVIKEKRATFSPRVGVETIRPSNTTNVRNLFLAGDWTDTKLPATIEGAIRSGNACSNLVQAMLRE